MYNHIYITITKVGTGEVDSLIRDPINTFQNRACSHARTHPPTQPHTHTHTHSEDLLPPPCPPHGSRLSRMVMSVRPVAHTNILKTHSLGNMILLEPHTGSERNTRTSSSLRNMVWVDHRHHWGTLSGPQTSLGNMV